MPSTRTITGGKEGYNIAIAKHFVGEEEEKEQYTCHPGYVIYKANGPLNVMRHEALTKVFILR